MTTFLILFMSLAISGFMIWSMGKREKNRVFRFTSFEDEDHVQHVFLVYSPNFVSTSSSLLESVVFTTVARVFLLTELNNIDDVISKAKPPIFWKDKEITKQQIYKWSPENIKNSIFKVSELELLVKKNMNNSMNLTTNFILDEASN